MGPEALTQEARSALERATGPWNQARKGAFPAFPQEYAFPRNPELSRN